MIKHFLMVGAGGFIGAVARFSICGLVHRYFKGGFPAGTLVVNALGCFAIGIAMYVITDRQYFSHSVRLFCTIGFLGAFTTFSTFGHETFELMKASSFHLALGNVAANVLIGITAVIGGRAFAGFLGI